jgi:2-polyprenyl-6-methoxyphenol hydroxylase-like FAD-dependent oxidoreductase
MSSEPILIVGGGLGGLTTALALARRGWSARVLEGAPEFGAIGYGIQFGPNIFHVFDRIGVTDQVLAAADSPVAVVMMDALTGRELVRIPTGVAFRARFKHPYIIVHRVDVHNVLLDACRQNDLIELVPEAMVTAFEDRGDRVAVSTADGRTFTGAAVVASDGVRSLFREKLIGRRPIGDRDPVRHWHKGRIVLIGDAAHAPLQSLAQGACMAIEDGLCLAELIHAMEGDFAGAFARFTAARLIRTARVQLESRALWEFYHAEGIARDVRNATVATWDGAHMFDCLAWLYDGFPIPEVNGR